RVDLGEARHVFDGHLDRQLEALLVARVDDRDRPRPWGLPARVEAPEQARDLVERALRRAQADALEGARRRLALATQRLEALEREEEVRAALAVDHRVDLVDDDRLDGAQRLAALRGEQEVERLRGRDEDVWRMPLHPRA